MLYCVCYIFVACFVYPLIVWKFVVKTYGAIALLIITTHRNLEIVERKRGYNDKQKWLYDKKIDDNNIESAFKNIWRN